MITRYKLRKGFERGIVKIADWSNECTSLCCCIGNYSFYFAGLEDSDMTAKEFWSRYNLEEVVDCIYEILKSREAASQNGIYDDEYDYYNVFLNRKEID